MNDELILSDGILWDVNSGKEIHKFDKLNQTLNGVFHPNGIEVVSNTEVWDLRTFHLLKTVPALDQMEIVFSPVNNVIYAVSVDQETEDETHCPTSYKTLDALDYSSIGKLLLLLEISQQSLNCTYFWGILCSYVRREEGNLRLGLQQI